MCVFRVLVMIILLLIAMSATMAALV